MKKNYLILIFIVLLAGCSNNSANNSVSVEQKVANGVSKLSTPQEIENLISGGQLNTIMLKGQSNGGLVDLIKLGIDKTTGSRVDKNVDIIMNVGSNSIFVFDNINNVDKILGEVYQKNNGKEILEDGRFIFVNRVLPLYKEEGIKKLSDQYGFRYEIVD